jgi:hypothetical protein
MQFERMPEQQCREALAQMAPLREQIAAVCVGPDGQSITWQDLGERQ